jgi:hypothetical protein
MYSIHTVPPSLNSCIVCDVTNTTIPVAELNREYQKVLDDIIEQGADCFEGDIPTEIQTDANSKKFNQQLSAYTTAKERLTQYQVALGREEVVESKPGPEQVWDEEAMEMVDVMVDIITVTAIEPVDATVTRIIYPDDVLTEEVTEETIENPLITKDKAERAEAQAIVDATPQSVIDAS